MPNVTVPGAGQSTVTLSYDVNANALLARFVAGLIGTGLADGKIQAADNGAGPPPALPPGVTGELVLSQSGTTLLPAKYDYVVDQASSTTLFGNGDANEQILAGGGKLSFFATSGSGSVITGGGNNLVSILPSDAGNWRIALGNGNDSIRALGGGADTISVGTGKSLIQLGNGSDFVSTGGSDTIMAAGGSETISASDSAKEVIFGNASKLFFVAGGASTVLGGTGSDTVFGGTGRQVLEGGTSGGNFLQAGDGRATLFGGGDNDQLYAGGDKRQELHAASGNETLSGAFATGKDTFYGGSGSDTMFGGANNTFVAGTGNATITTAPDAKNLFEFLSSSGGGTEQVMGLTAASQVHIELVGYGANETTFALNHQTVTNGSVSVTLSDNTTVTFENVGHLSSKNFS